MNDATENVRVLVVPDDLTPVPTLCDEALKMLDDLISQLVHAETDDARFWLCCAVSSCEQLGVALMAHAGNDCGRWRSARQVSQDHFGRMVQPGRAREIKGPRFGTDGKLGQAV